MVLQSVWRSGAQLVEVQAAHHTLLQRCDAHFRRRRLTAVEPTGSLLFRSRPMRFALSSRVKISHILVGWPGRVGFGATDELVQWLQNG